MPPAPVRISNNVNDSAWMPTSVAASPFTPASKKRTPSHGFIVVSDMR